jgi:hypothetical protein
MTKPIGVDIVFGSLDPIVRDALSYLVLVQNKLQSVFEFRIVQPDPADGLLLILASEGGVDSEKVVSEGAGFAQRTRQFNKTFAGRYDLQVDEGSILILLSAARLTDNFYLVSGKSWALIALGGWEREFSPPSIIEYYLTFIIAAVASIVAPRLPDHHETRGCLCDFNVTLRDARYSVLTGHLCELCAAEIRNSSSDSTVKLGDEAKPSEIALVVKKLGFDLFRTSGVKPTLKERLLATLEQEGFKNILSTSFQILFLFITILLIYLGFKLK